MIKNTYIILHSYLYCSLLTYIAHSNTAYSVGSLVQFYFSPSKLSGS